MPMKKQLTQNLIDLLAAYQAKPEHGGEYLSHRLAPATLSKRAAGNDEFYGRVPEADFNFGVITYDRVVQWFADNWPADAVWPADVDRPSRINRPKKSPQRRVA